MTEKRAADGFLVIARNEAIQKIQKNMKKIYEYSCKYLALNTVVRLFMRIYYRKIYMRGQENIPFDCPIIFAPNHKNALMDPLLILYSLPKEQVVFMARGDIFANKTIAKIMRFLKILPVFRMRDGIGSLGKNEEPFAEAIDTLKTNHKLCLMPEGQQIEQRKLLPLVKGMFRIGFHAQEKFGNSPGVKIVPVGIDYEDLHFAGYNVSVQFGKPIELSDYYDLYTEDQPKAYNLLRKDLSPRMSELMLNITSNDYYDAIYLVTLLEVDNYLKEHNLDENVWNKLKAKQEISKQYCEEEKNNPEKIKALNDDMQKLYISEKSADEIVRKMKKKTPFDYVKMICCTLLLFPGLLFMLLPYSVIKFLTRKLLDSGFYSSVSFGLGILIPAFFFMVYFLIAAIFIPFSCSALLFLLIAPICSVVWFRLKNLY